MPDTAGNNRRALEAYDRLVNSDSLEESRSAKTELAGQKFAFEQAQKLSEAQRKAGEFQQTNSRLTTNSAALQTLHEAQIAAMKAREEAVVAKQQADAAHSAAKDDLTAKTAKAATAIFSGLAGLDKSDSKYESKVHQLLADNPDAIWNPAVKDIVEHNLTSYSQQQAALVKAQQPKIEAYQDALAASHPVYGTSPDMRTFTPTVAGQAEQTHVQTTFQGPNGVPVTKILPRDFFDNAVAASLARKSAGDPYDTGATVAPTTPNPAVPVAVAAPVMTEAQAVTTGAPGATATPAAPVIPPDHAAFLMAHPEKAASFDAQYGAGASAAVLKPIVAAPPAPAASDQPTQ